MYTITVLYILLRHSSKTQNSVTQKRKGDARIVTPAISIRLKRKSAFNRRSFPRATAVLHSLRFSGVSGEVPFLGGPAALALDTQTAKEAAQRFGELRRLPSYSDSAKSESIFGHSAGLCQRVSIWVLQQKRECRSR